MSSQDSTDFSFSERTLRIARVLDEILERRGAGETLTPEAILAQHPDLMPELGEQLVQIGALQQAVLTGRTAAPLTGPTLSAPGALPTPGTDAPASTSSPGAAATAEPFPGYHILTEIHRGGQGVVYQALQRSTQRKVALKVMKEGPFAGSADRARFEREVQILGQLNHPNIVGILDSGVAGGSYYFVMDYIDGESLDAHIERKRDQGTKGSKDGGAGGSSGTEKKTPPRAGRSAAWTVNHTLQLFVKICDAVNAAHLRGVIHRDLKPSNIRIDAAGEPYVLDFGLAKTVTDSGNPAMTRTGDFVGSLPWSSPEQAEGRPSQTDLRTDVYSLGVMLYQMLTGKFPYEVTGNFREVLNRIATAEPVRPSTLRDPHGQRVRTINDEVETIVLKCLQKERERRYQSAGELARDLRHYLNGEPIEAKRDSVGYVLRKTLNRYRLPVGFAAVFVLFISLSAIVLYSLYREQSRERQRAETAQTREAQQRTLAEANERKAQAAAQQAESESANAKKERKKAEQVAAFMRQMLEGVGPGVAHGRDTTLLKEMMDKAVTRIENGELKAAPEAELYLRWTIGNTYREIAHGEAFDQAQRVLQAALDLARTLHEGDHTDIANSLNNLAGLLHVRGDLAAAKPLYQEALDMRRRLFPGAHADVAMSLNNLAALAFAYGDLTTAESLLHEALEMHRRLTPGDHVNVAGSLNNLAGVFYARGDLAAAEPLYYEALEMTRRLYPGDHPDVASSMANLAELLRKRGNLAEAEPLCREALEMQRRIFPGDHPDVANSLRTLSFLLHTRGNLAEAEPLCREALEMQRRLFPNNHPDVAKSLNNLASILWDRGDQAETETLYRQALDMRRQLFPDGHPDTAKSLNNLAMLLKDRGDWTAAESLYREALSIQDKCLPPNHLDRLVTLEHLGLALLQQEKYAEAEPVIVEVAKKTRSAAACQRVIQLYDAWHTAQPGKGYDQKAAAWRAKLPPTPSTPAGPSAP